MGYKVKIKTIVQKEYNNILRTTDNHTHTSNNFLNEYKCHIIFKHISTQNTNNSMPTLHAGTWTKESKTGERADPSG